MSTHFMFTVAPPPFAPPASHETFKAKGSVSLPSSQIGWVISLFCWIGTHSTITASGGVSMAICKMLKPSRGWARSVTQQTHPRPEKIAQESGWKYQNKARETHGGGVGYGEAFQASGCQCVSAEWVGGGGVGEGAGSNAVAWYQYPSNWEWVISCTSAAGDWSENFHRPLLFVG